MTDEQARRWLEPQPPPITTEQSSSVTELALDSVASSRVKTLLRLRREQGQQKYGTELMTHNGRDPRQDLLQELVDALVYAIQDTAENVRWPVGRGRISAIALLLDEVAAELESEGIGL